MGVVEEKWGLKGRWKKENGGEGKGGEQKSRELCSSKNSF